MGLSDDGAKTDAVALLLLAAPPAGRVERGGRGYD